MKKILVIQTASIGDVILATPVLEKLHATYPSAAIDFLTKNGNEGILKDHPFIRRLIIWDKQENKYRHFLQVLRAIRERNYDLVVNMQRFATTGFLTAFSGAGMTIGFNKNPFAVFFSKSVKHKIGDGTHERDRNHELIRSLTDDTPGPVKLYTGKMANAKMSQYKTAAYICIAPTSLWYTKQYPLEQWAEFVGELPQSLRVYFIGSKADETACEQIIRNSGHRNALNLAGQLNLLESAALMQGALMNYVNDSAPQH
ncbi:MAG: glycosyltransferase family 9 protein, partial [Bacteroidales bacterium]|nr:glycosyltransferase family 9 protein [Bacteroidales bacterium]